MNVPKNRIKTCTAVSVISKFAPLDLAKRSVAEILAQEIIAKLLEFNKIRVVREDGDILLVEGHVDIIVPK